MKARLVLLLALLSVAPAWGKDAAGQLLQQAQSAQAEAGKLNQEREQRFLRDKNQQAALVQKAEAELAQVRSRADAERAKFDAEQRDIAALKSQLKERAGDYLQVSAAVREVAGEMHALAADSLITPQFPERLDVLDQASHSDELPSIDTLEKLASVLMQQISESGRVARFKTEIIDAEGVRKPADVVRVGDFSAMADGDYLVDSDTGAELRAPARQPGWRLRHLASAFAGETSGYADIMVDPSRGNLLLIEGEQPSLIERIQQGGLVGYLILVIGIVGLIIAAWQFIYLSKVGRAMRAQLQRLHQPSADNPLGRVLTVFSDDPAHRQDDPELLELRLSEAVLREMPPLERTQSMLKLFAAMAPLLGLLGTVTGMILTFQAITVFGTGDPKLMAGGISQALVTTVLGLTAAIPLLFLHSLLATRARALIQILDEQSARVLAARLESADV